MRNLSLKMSMAKKPWSGFIALIVMTFTTNVKAAEISCPKMFCEDPLLDGKIDYDLCWSVDEE